MKQPVVLTIAGLVLILCLSLFFSLPPIADAKRPLPPNDPTRGLLYDGLEITTTGECRGGFKIQLPGHVGKTLCTHGPDAATDVVKFARGVSPAPILARDSTQGVVACDGDGTSGNRVQVLYVHAADVPSRYDTYLASFQQWSVEVDNIFKESAAETGGVRRVRFVTDANCKPQITHVTLSAQGDDSFGKMISELWAQGYNRTDRKYLLFADARGYCGISNIEFDDSPEQWNANNSGPHFARVDAACWSSVIAAHELMHMFGGVQLTAPNSDGNFHCRDGYDNMCDHSGQPIQIVCPDATNDYRFDCGHEDYFNVNPAVGSYLATHWNTANSKFLISSTPAEATSTIKAFIPLIQK